MRKVLSATLVAGQYGNIIFLTQRASRRAGNKVTPPSPNLVPRCFEKLRRFPAFVASRRRLDSPHGFIVALPLDFFRARSGRRAAFGGGRS
jgi:hypothetical protein